MKSSIIAYATSIAGVLKLIPTAFEDYRGSYTELFDRDAFLNCIGEHDFYRNMVFPEFVQDDIAVSYRSVLRGLHGDFVTYKLVTVLHGAAYCIIADNRQESVTYKKWAGFVLTSANRNQLLLPPGMGNSMYALQDDTRYYYKQTTHFVPGSQFTIKWNDPEWNFEWPISGQPIVSKRDEQGHY